MLKKVLYRKHQTWSKVQLCCSPPTGRLDTPAWPTHTPMQCNITKVFEVAMYTYTNMLVETIFKQWLCKITSKSCCGDFKAQFGAATIRGWLDFEGGVYRDRHACAHTASIISLQRFSKILQHSSKSALANQNAALDRSQTRFMHMLEHELESRFEICILIGPTHNFRFLTCVARNHCICMHV